jgi:hypothetical protein
MRNALLRLSLILAAATLAACGGGSSGTSTAGASSASASGLAGADDALSAVPSPNSTPSAELVAVQSVANALQALVADGYFGAEAAALGRTIVAKDISQFVDINGMKIEVEQYASFMVASCTDSSGTVEVTLPQTVIDESLLVKKLLIIGRAQSSNTYKNCKSNTFDAQGNTFYRYTNGTTTVSHRRYNSETDYAYTVALNGLMIETIENGVTVQKTLTGANSCDTLFSTTCFFSNDGLRGWGPTTMTNGVANGSFATLFNGGIIKVTYFNYDSVGGSASIAGANGTSASIFRQSATKFSASITPKNGVAVAFTFAAKI